MLGPPGAGKGTQADILAAQWGFFHFETSKIVEENLLAHDDDDTIVVDEVAYRYGDEKRRFESGVLVTPAVIAFWVSQKIRELAGRGKTIVFSGSPRTLPEAETLVPLLEDLYKRVALRALVITIPEEESIRRNSHRRICERCRAPVPFLPETEGLTTCERCGGKLVQRGALDTPEVIRVRLKEYSERTAPIIAFLLQRGILLRQIDGMAGIAAVADRVGEALRDGVAITHVGTNRKV